MTPNKMQVEAATELCDECREPAPSGSKLARLVCGHQLCIVCSNGVAVSRHVSQLCGWRDGPSG